VCFVTGEPSGLTVTLPKAAGGTEEGRGAGREDHARLSTAAARMRRCSGTAATRTRTGVTYRRAPRLAVPAMLPVITTVSYAGPRPADRLGRGRPVPDQKTTARPGRSPSSSTARFALQILTSDFRCVARRRSWPWLKSRWREEELPQVRLGETTAIDKICDYLATISENTKITGNPAPQEGERPAVHEAEKKTLAAARGGNWPGPARRPRHHPPPPRTPASPPLQRKINPGALPPPRPASRRPATPSPPKTARPAPSTQTRKTALLARRPARRGLQMVLRLLAHNRRALAIGPPQRLPARTTTEIPRHHPRKPSSAASPAPSPAPPPRSPSTLPAARRTPASPAPLAPAPSTKSTPTPARHSRRHPPHHLPARAASQHLTPSAQPPPGDLGASSARPCKTPPHPRKPQARNPA